ncbi:hypothetical protein ACUHMQ_05720 [Chitinimonas sp. PSY-7]|uniref:hypothetical protein n=1 Tax=Chitinimonas sp. PSY-7 TaxID=3459088 RepID=UPI00403FEE0A
MPKLSRSPIHLLSAIVTLTTDKLWDLLLLDMARHLPLVEQGRFLLMTGLLLLVITTFSTTLTQYWIENESRGVALAKGLSLGVLAGIPYSFGDTEVGLVFMAWSGINELQKASMQD